MKNIWILIFVASGIALAGVALKSKAPRDPKCATIKLDQTLSVNTLFDVPQCISGQVMVEGTVNSVIKDKGSLLLIDRSEKDNCEDNCPIRRLPISWSGEMPAKGDIVEVSGKIAKQQDGKLIVEAKELRILPEVAKQ